MKKLILFAIVLALAWQGSALYHRYGPGLMARASSSSTTTTKCITKSGEVIYGTVPPGTTCERLEPIAGAFTVVHSKTPAQRRNAQTTSSFGSRAEDRGTSGFICDGRTYCSQMTSCAEATFFLRNCPNMRIDGNGDGIPCEKQWCTVAARALGGGSD